MSFNGPPTPSPEKPTSTPEAVETQKVPEYWKDNPQFVYPKGLFETQFALAKLMAEREDIPLLKAIQDYAPLLNKAIRTEDEEHELLPGITDENLLETGYAEVLERRKKYPRNGLPYRNPEGLRFGCSSYDYDESAKAIHVHFFNAEADEEWKDGKEMSKSPLDESKLERRRHELTEMLTEIKAKHPDALYVRGRSNLYNFKSYRRLYPDSYVVGQISYDPELWKQGNGIWGQFLGGHEKQKGEYGFKRELAEQFLEKAKDTPIDRLADALPNPPKFAAGDIQDFYELYGVT